MGGDINAQVGRGDCEEYEDTLGNWGIEERHDKGRKLLHVYMTHKLLVMNTYFKHDEYWTYMSFNTERTKCMLDVIVTSPAMFGNVTNCHVTRIGIKSDHRAIKITFTLDTMKLNVSTTPKCDIDNNALRNEKNDEYNERLQNMLSNAETMYEEWCETLVQAASMTATKPKKEIKSWFDYNATALIPLIRRRDLLLHSLYEIGRFVRDEDGKWTDIGPMEDRRETLNKFKKEINDQLLIAFENWAHAQAVRIDNMTFNPKDGWDAIYHR